MKLNVYTIFDAAAKAYTAPFFLPNDGLALRAFIDNVNSTEENNISKHPDQFTLFHVATWDDQQATMEQVEKRSLGNGLTFKNETDTSRMEKILELLETKLEDK